jgi:hypothetical protein
MDIIPDPGWEKKKLISYQILVGKKRYCISKKPSE